MRPSHAISLLCGLAAVGAPPAVPVAGQEPVPPLFAESSALELTLEADFARLRDDRDDDSPERPARVVVTGVDGAPLRLDAQLRTRGNFRRDRANCFMPPLRLNLRKGQVEGTVFDGQDKLKLVHNCRPGRASYAALVLREYLAYRLLGLVTAESFRVRLLRISYVDTSGSEERWSDVGFLIEDDDDLAERLGGVAFELEEGRNLPARVFDPVSATRVAVFQYMIGNTDWSEVRGHNVQIVETPTSARVVPYDFDFSGLVDAPYATPDPDIGIRSVRERRYQGWCRPPVVTSAVLEGFRGQRDAAARLVRGLTAMEADERQAIADYLEPFWDSIESDERAEAVFLGLCRRLPEG